MRTRHLGILLLTTLAAALFLAGCASNDAARGRASAMQIRMDARDLSFEPGALTLTAGTAYELTLTNQGALLHDWTVESIPVRDVTEKGSGAHDMGQMPGMSGSSTANGDPTTRLHIAAQGGKTGSLRFTPTRAGEYEFWCTVPGHREAGMRGRLVVTG